jgi:excisionase family DNA binding protein
MKIWLTVAEAAEYAGLSRDTIYTACERRELRHARVGGRRTIRLKPEWIDAWLEQHACGAAHAADRTVTIAAGALTSAATSTTANRGVHSPAPGRGSGDRS